MRGEMNGRDDNSQWQQEQQEEQSWREEHEGMWECPYCGNVWHELRPCCGEMHSEQIQIGDEK